MQLSLVFRAVLLLYLLALLLNGASSEKKSIRNRKSKCQKKEKWVILDPSLNLSMNVPPSPSRSLSPWTYQESYDSSRIPSKISEAKCEKKSCITENGEEDLGLESKPDQRLEESEEQKRYALQPSAGD